MGRVAAELFAAEGARVVVADLVDGSATVEAIDSTGGEATFVALDVGDDDSVRAGIQHAIVTFGGLDVLYNNARISPADDDDPTTTSNSTWTQVLDVNVTGVARCCRHGIPAMLVTGGGSIINVASFVAHMGAATPQIAYTASKGAVVSMTREIAVIYARQGLRANALCPGPVLTPTACSRRTPTRSVSLSIGPVTISPPSPGSGNGQPRRSWPRSGPTCPGSRPQATSPRGVGMAPGNNITGGKRQSGRTTKGDVWLTETPTQCAWAADRSPNTYLAAQFW